MTVSYRIAMIDTWQYLSYLSTKTITGRCFLALFLAAPFVGLIGLYHGASLHLMVITSCFMVGGIYVMLFFSGLLGLYLGTLITPTATLTIDAEFCRFKTFVGVKSPWKQFLTITEEPDYFYFIGWARAFYIPKRAFDTSTEAYAFFDTALAYWRQAKGIAPPPAPDVSGVWPPAPHATDSQEPGETPKH